MTDSQINFKNRFFAGLLGYLIPGAGHLYQGRTFKGIVYFVCIFGMFLCGMSLSNWRCVYWSNEPGKKTYGYFAQLGVGAPSLPAYFQSRRFINQNNDDIDKLDRKIAAQFTGKFSKFVNFQKSETLEITGVLEIEPKHGTFEGMFRGTTQNENGASESIELKLGGHLLLEKPLKATRDRALKSSVVDDNGQIGEIAGYIPRRFFDRFEMPLDDDVLQKMHNTGRPWELALVMTWIAGLLNILAVWDAVEGPAYGYDDKELKEEEQKKSKEKEEKKKKSQTASQKTTEEKNGATPPAEKPKTEPATISRPTSPTAEAKEEN